MKIKIADIKIGQRQRIDLGDIEDLADSIKRLGQIHNIGVRAEDNQLIWGMRRLTAAKLLGWEEIDATVRPGLTEDMEQEIELEEDIKRKNRSWQEICLATAKLFRIKKRAAVQRGEKFNIRSMAAYTGQSLGLVSDYINKIAEGLSVNPKDEQLWSCNNYTEALQVLRGRAESAAQAELERRRQLTLQSKQAIELVKQQNPTVFQAANPSIVQTLNTTEKPVRLTLRDRAELYNKAYVHLAPPNTPLVYHNKDGKEFIHAFWFVSGGNISELYGSYQIEYLKRIGTLFPDAQKVVHLFVGSLPPSDKYVRVGLAQGDTKPDIECDAHYLSSKLPFKADVIYADPPYSVEDSEHYDSPMVNRERVLEEAALCLNDGGYIVWMDQALPIFKNELINLVGAISYIRSTGNRFRVVAIFRKAPTCKTISSTPINNQSEFPNPGVL